MLNIVFSLFLACQNDYGIIHEKIVEVPASDTAEEIWIESFIQPIESEGVDIIWVVDRSGSMHDNDDKLTAGIEAMMTALPADLSWRIGIISTDPRESANNSEFPLVPGQTAQDAMDMIDGLNYNGYPTSLETGFDSLYSYIVENPYSATWLRHEASVLAIFVSDEDDQSLMLPIEFITWFQSYRINSYVAAIVAPEDSCEPIMNVGYNYTEAVALMGGVNVDICSDDWVPGIQQALNSAAHVEEWTLSHLAEEDSIVIFENNKPFLDWFYDLSENKIVFTTIPRGGAFVEIGYHILE